MIMKKFPVLHDNLLGKFFRYFIGEILTCFLCEKIANIPCSGNICQAKGQVERFS